MPSEPVAEMSILDVVAGTIVHLEVLNREDIRQKLVIALPQQDSIVRFQLPTKQSLKRPFRAECFYGQTVRLLAYRARPAYDKNLPYLDVFHCSKDELNAEAMWCGLHRREEGKGNRQESACST